MDPIMEPDADEAAEIEELEKDLDALHANMEDKHSRDYDVTERQWNQINSHSGHSHSKGSSSGGDGRNTGPKGVLTDYAEAKQKMMQKMERDHDELDEEAKLERELQAAEAEFLKSFEEHHMRELQRRQVAATAEALPGAVSGNSGSRRFGDVSRVSRDGFVDFIDNELPNTTILIHIYQNSIRSCARLRAVLLDMAKTYPTVKFGEMLSTDAQLSFDDLALPALLVYRGGNLMESFVRITEDIGFNFDFDDLEDFLVEKRLLNRRDAVQILE